MVTAADGRGAHGTMPATVGVLHDNLTFAIQRALRLDPLAAAVYGAGFGWNRATDQFEAALRAALIPPLPAQAPERPRTAVPA